MILTTIFFFFFFLHGAGRDNATLLTQCLAFQKRKRFNTAKYVEVKCKPIAISLDTYVVKCSEKTDTFCPSTQTPPAVTRRDSHTQTIKFPKV